MRSACALVLFAVASVARAEDGAGALSIEPAEPRLGDLVVVYLDNADPDLTSAPLAAFGFETSLHRVAPSLLRGILAVPIEMRARSHRVAVALPDRTIEVWVPIREREWATDALRVNPRFTKAQPAALKERLLREDRAWEDLWLSEPSTPKHVGPVVRPVPGETTATIGTRRVFNDVAMSTHYGLDLDGSIGDRVVAAMPGRVVMSSMRWMTGGTILVDHGGGLFTGYFHLSRRDKRPQDWVNAGERLGLVGSTGRVTGPHLHLAVIVRMLEQRLDGSLRPVELYAEPATLFDRSFLGDPSHLDRPPAPARPGAAVSSGEAVPRSGGR